MKIYIDGTCYDRSDARISVYDHGLLYGDGIFEGIRIYNGHPFLLAEHIHRLYDSARAIALTVPMSMDEMTAAVAETVSLNGRSGRGESGYIRIVVTRGCGDLGMDPSKCQRPTVIIIVDDISLYPEEYYETGIAVITSSVRRMPVDTVNPRIKSLNYLNNILARIEARQSGAFEALLLNHTGCIAECTGDNIFLVKGNTVMTPPLTSGALGGITRELVISLLDTETEVTVAEMNITQYDLYTADECFLTGSAAEIMPVVKADGRVIGDGLPGPVSTRVRELFLGYIQDYEPER
ncbi:MAG: branched-chain-amino-acid transaminase [Spirochaetota bacterium]